MYESNASGLSVSDRWAASLMAAAITFIAGYTVARVSLMSADTTTPVNVQQNVIPHEGELWKEFGG